MRVPETEEREFKLIPAGPHVARCTQVIDLGSQKTPWGNKPKVLIGWELPNFLSEATREKPSEPVLKWKEYGLSLHVDSHLCRDINGWRGKVLTADEKKVFDLRSLLDKPCMLNIVHVAGKGDRSDRTYANIANVMKLPAGQSLPDRHHELLYFSLSEFDKAVFDTFSEKLQIKIQETPEYGRVIGGRNEQQYSEPVQTASGGHASTGALPEDDIPF